MNMETDHERDSAQIPGDLEMTFGHFFSEWYYNIAPPRRYCTSILLLLIVFMARACEPNLLTIYRPKKPVAPKTVAVCPPNEDLEHSISNFSRALWSVEFEPTCHPVHE